MSIESFAKRKCHYVSNYVIITGYICHCGIYLSCIYNSGELVEDVLQMLIQIDQILNIKLFDYAQGLFTIQKYIQSVTDVFNSEHDKRRESLNPGY